MVVLEGLDDNLFILLESFRGVLNGKTIILDGGFDHASDIL